MLNLYPHYVAWHYFLFVTAAALGTIQAAANRAGLRGLQIGGRLWRRELAGGVLILSWLGSAVAFVRFTPDYLSPGLAGSELMAVFGAGVLAAALISTIGALASPGGGSWAQPTLSGQVGMAADYLYQVMHPIGLPRGLAVVLPDPDLPPASVLPLITVVSELDLLAVVVSWGAGPELRYPDVLAVVPMAITAQQAAEGQALGPVVVVGMGLGGDLALRSASDDARIRLAVAVGPGLEPEGVLQGLMLLREMNMVQAWGWRSSWERRRFVGSVQGGAALLRLGARGAVLASADDGFFVCPASTLEPASEQGSHVEVVTGVSHTGLIRDYAPERVRGLLQAALEDRAAVS